MCNCVELVNKELLRNGCNTKISTPMVLSDDLSNMTTKVAIAVEKADPSIRKKPTTVFSSYCPFCGTKNGTSE